MKKLITVAALASVAFTADFLGQHKPVPVIQDGLNIVKDVKSHSYGKLIKDGVKLHKDLNLEDQELFLPPIPEDSQGKLKLARETVSKFELLVKQYEAGISYVKVKDPKGYADYLKGYEEAKQQLLFARQGLELLESLIGGGKKARSSLKDLKLMLTFTEHLVKQEEELLPKIKQFFPETYELCLGEYKEMKKAIEDGKKEVVKREKEDSQKMLGTSSKSIGDAIKSRKLKAQSEEVKTLRDEAVEISLNGVKQVVAQEDIRVKQAEQLLPKIEIAFPVTYQQVFDEYNSRKRTVAAMKTTTIMMEISIRSSVSVGEDFNKFLNDVDKELKKQKEQIARLEGDQKERERRKNTIPNYESVYKGWSVEIAKNKKDYETLVNLVQEFKNSFSSLQKSLQQV